MDQVRENGATSGAGLLADYTYDALGRPTALARGNGAGTSWSYVANTRNWSMTQNLSGTANDLTLGFTFSPAVQVTERAISNTVYSFTPPTLSEAYTRDGLNRYTAVAGQAFTYDGRQNLTDDGPNTYAYDVENRLTAVSGASAMTLAYDPLGRLKQTASGATTTRFLYDGDRLIGEYNAAGTTVTARYAHGAGVDAPLVWYEGATLTDRRWLHADAQGSIIAVSGATGTIVGTPYSYSPYGEPDAVNGWGGSRFRYTGQISLRHAPLWHYKARVYDPALGRFLQTDPVGYEDQMNLYAYVGNDPVNGTDPTGLCEVTPDGDLIDCELKFRDLTPEQQAALRDAIIAIGTAIQNGGTDEAKELWANASAITVGPRVTSRGRRDAEAFWTRPRRLPEGDVGRNGRLFFNSGPITDGQGIVDINEFNINFFHELYHGAYRSLCCYVIEDEWENLTELLGVTEGRRLGLIRPGSAYRVWRNGNQFRQGAR